MRSIPPIARDHLGRRERLVTVVGRAEGECQFRLQPIELLALHVAQDQVADV